MFLKLLQFLEPKLTLSSDEVRRGLRWMTWEGVASQAMFSVATSGLLAAFALALGADSFSIGVLAAVPFLAQPVQIPAIWLVERVRRRKAIAVTTWLVAQSLWVPVALIPLMMGAPSRAAVGLLIGLLATRGVFAAVCTCSWNGWARDLVPRRLLGRFFSRRWALSILGSMTFALAGALFVDLWRGRASDEATIWGYTAVLLFGAVFLGMGSAVLMALIPEPQMQGAPGPGFSLGRTLAAPVRDVNFQRLMKFLFFWAFASNLAVPFFVVYMLLRLELPLSLVIALGILSQLFNVWFVRVWGRFIDRFGGKAVLSLSASLYLLVILGWALVSLGPTGFGAIPWLVVLHIFQGVATAGVTLAAGPTGTLGLKLAPPGRATAYLAGASLATNLGAGLGPLAGGALIDIFNRAALAKALPVVGARLTGFELLFALAFALGLVTLRVLTSLREEGEARPETVLDELLARTQEMTRGARSVPGLSMVAHFPYSYLRRVPGLDVALGVTAYEIAASVKTAITAAALGREATADVAEQVGRVVLQLVGRVENLGERTVDLALHGARGALHAAAELGEDVEHLAKHAVIGVFNSLAWVSVDPWATFWGAGHGVVQGAEEAGADMGEAAQQAVQGAREAAQHAGLPATVAAAQAAQGALAAAEAMNPEAASRVRDALSLELMEVPTSVSRGEGPQDTPGR